MKQRKFDSSLSGRISELAYLEAANIVRHEDVDAWYAPSECHVDVERGHESEVAEFFTRIGMTPEEFWAEVERRTSGKWAYFGWQNLVSKLAWDLSPFNDKPAEQEPTPEQRMEQMSLTELIQTTAPTDSQFNY